MKFLKKIQGVLIYSMMGFSVFAKAPLNLNQTNYEKILKESIVSKGNNYRLKTVIEKMKKGQKVWVAALGGSVTEGAGPANFTDGYAYQFFRALKDNFTPDEGKNLNFNNAGLSGTSSILGLVRYDSDVTEICGRSPDLLIIEFAVNDDGSESTQIAFEGIVRKVLLANPETAIIALYSAADYGNTMAQKKPVADYYSIPQVNMLKSVKESIDKKLFTHDEYFTDNVHPTLEGHQLVTACLINLINTIDKDKKDSAIKVPEKLFKTPGFNNFIRILGDDDNVRIVKGGFKDTDLQTQSLKKTNKGNFPINWYKQATNKNEPFVLNINCKNFIFTYKVQGSWLTEKYGEAEIYVDGKLFKTVDGGAKNGWNNCENLILINEKTSANHKIEVKMAKGSEDKGFTIVAMGYSK